MCHQRTDEGTTQSASSENATSHLYASKEQTKEPHNQPADQPRNYVPEKKPHNQPADEKATSQLQLRTDGGTTQPTPDENATSQLCANKEQMKEPHKQPAKTGRQTMNR
jgi:hypothetical protein